MPKRTKPPPRTKEKTIDDWLVILGALGMGGLLIGWGISNGWNLELIVFGLIFGGASVLGTPEFRIYLKLTVNRVSGKEVFQISEVRNSTVYKGGFHYHEAPNRGKSETERAEIESVREAELLVDEAFQLGGGEDRRFELDLEEGDRLVGEVKASGTLCAYLLTPNSYR